MVNAVEELKEPPVVNPRFLKTCERFHDGVTKVYRDILFGRQCDPDGDADIFWHLDMGLRPLTGIRMGVNPFGFGPDSDKSREKTHLALRWSLTNHFTQGYWLLSGPYQNRILEPVDPESHVLRDFILGVESVAREGGFERLDRERYRKLASPSSGVWYNPDLRVHARFR